jgi:type VI secretion system secreted protein VgrG
VEGEEPPEQYDYPGNYAERDDGDRLARIRLEEQEARRVVIEGEGNVRTLASGYKFELREHYLRDMNVQYLITSVTHSMDTGSYRAGGEQRNEYSCGFEAIPVSTPYRPPRVTGKPRIHGTQTAVVVGSPGEEIWLDEYGRVRLHFHWDRVGQRNEQSSCWVRVSQGWAGRNWGMAHWPRIGQEVVVSFLEGNPDRPLVTGRVYNADQMPPYELPASGEISGIKTSSSPGGSGYNELSFDDTAGSELIVLHGEKDWNITIKNDETQTVGRNRTETVQQNEEVTVGANRSVSIGSNDEQNVGSMLRITAGTSIELINGGNSIKMDSMGITIRSAGIVTIQGSMVKIN